MEKLTNEELLKLKLISTEATMFRSQIDKCQLTVELANRSIEKNKADFETLMQELKAKYKLKENDTYDTKTGEIKRGLKNDTRKLAAEKN